MIGENDALDLWGVQGGNVCILVCLESLQNDREVSVLLQPRKRLFPCQSRVSSLKQRLANATSAADFDASVIRQSIGIRGVLRMLATLIVLSLARNRGVQGQTDEFDGFQLVDPSEHRLTL